MNPSIKTLRHLLATGIVAFACLRPLQAQTPSIPLEISGIFSDHMVLQRRMKIPVWGWASPGEKIVVSIDSQSQTTTTGEQGKWRVDLAPMEAGAPRKMTIKGNTASIEISDILLGEVWLCSGQSNMEWDLSHAKDGAQEVATADHPDIRLFNLAKDGGNTRAKSPAARLPVYAEKFKLPKDTWEVCSPQSAGDKFSAVGYYFGRNLQADLHVPIGLISNPVGGSAIESWISRDAFESDPAFHVVPEYYDRLIEYCRTAEGKKEADRLSAEYEAKQEELKAQKKFPLWPLHFPAPAEKDEFTSVWFNTRVNPIIPFAMRGVIWYQGEANGYWKDNPGYPYEYRGLLPLLIKDWRSHWGEGDFPFLFVQLPNWGRPSPDLASGGGWALTREAQKMALKAPKTGMAVTIDIGDPENIHPINKQPVADRLSLAARAIAYDEKIIWSGPLYRDMKVEGPAIRLTFDHIGSGLEAKGGPLKQFAIAGADMKFVAADAVIDKDTVVVSSPAIAQPVAVRYAWQTNPEGCNLSNKDGLLASPFRTDEEPFTNGSFYKKKLQEPPDLKAKL